MNPELVLVVGDMFVPQRAPDISEQFKSILIPNKLQHVLSLGNIVLEPIIFNIDFTQIKAFIKFIPILFDFLAGAKKELIILQKNQKI